MKGVPAVTDDMKRMQQEAADRARQMQKQARSYPAEERTSYLPLTPPPLTRRHPPEEPEPRCPAEVEPTVPAAPSRPSSLLSSVTGDPDRALLLLLIVLLIKNNASLELIIALCYLAM